jgi:hypothetical protein
LPAFCILQHPLTGLTRDGLAHVLDVAHLHGLASHSRHLAIPIGRVAGFEEWRGSVGWEGLEVGA